MAYWDTGTVARSTSIQNLVLFGVVYSGKYQTLAMIGQIFQDFYVQGHRKRLSESDGLAKT